MSRWTLWRRRWCMWRGHPMAGWSPIVTYVPGRNGAPDFTRVQWRCAKHDKTEAHKV